MSPTLRMQMLKKHICAFTLVEYEPHIQIVNTINNASKTACHYIPLMKNNQIGGIF